MFCKNCGAELEDNQNFCINCGSKAQDCAEAGTQNGVNQNEGAAIQKEDVQPEEKESKKTVVAGVLIVCLIAVGIIVLSNIARDLIRWVLYSLA